MVGGKKNRGVGGYGGTEPFLPGGNGRGRQECSIGKDAILGEFFEKLGSEIFRERFHLIKIVTKRRERNIAADPGEWRIEAAKSWAINFFDYLITPFIGRNQVQRDIEVRLHGQQIGHPQ